MIMKIIKAFLKTTAIFTCSIAMSLLPLLFGGVGAIVLLMIVFAITFVAMIG